MDSNNAATLEKEYAQLSHQLNEQHKNKEHEDSDRDFNAAKIIEITNALVGLKFSNWKMIKEVVDRLYSAKSAKLELDGSDNLAEILKLNSK